MSDFNNGGASDKVDKFIGHMNTKEHFSNCGTSDKVEKFCGGCLLQENFEHNGQSDKGHSDKGQSDKGVSDKSTGEGFSDNRNANYLRKVYLLHILLVFPLFVLYGCLGKKTKMFGYDLVRIVGWVLLSFMGYSLLKSEITSNWNWTLKDMFNFRMKEDKKNSKRLRLVYLFHLLIITPVLLYFSRNNKKVDEKALGGICILGVSAFFYHGYSYWRSETTGEWNWNF